MTTTTTTTSHLSADDIEHVLEGDAADAVRAHLRSCAACAALVQREAVLDEEVSAIGAQLSFCPGCARPVVDEVTATVACSPRCTWCGVAFAPGGLRVEKVLAESDHGRLYLAHGDEGPVALKEIVFARVPDVEALDRFEREARLLKQLRQERIPRFVASFSEGEGVHLRMYLAQKYVDGPALDDELETRRFQEADARAIAAEVLAILVELQALSPPVLHRDIKPANLVRDAAGKLSLVDFGSARDVQKTTGGTLVGTFGYMPVEQLSGVVDESTDVYALGATLVHLLTRRPPWESSSGALPSSLSVSPGFHRFLARCLAPRDRRFPDAKVALAALADVDAVTSRRRTGVVVSGAVAAALCFAGIVATPFAYRAVEARLHAVPPVPPVPPAPPVPPVPPVSVLPPEYGDVGVAPEKAVPLLLHMGDVQALVNSHLGDIIACAKTSKFTGSLDASWTITPAGEAKDVSVKGSDSRLAMCMANVIKRWQFPERAAESGDMDVDIPFNFGEGDGAVVADAPKEKITMDLQDAELGNVIRLIGDVSGKNIVYGDDVHGKVTMKFKNIQWDQALDVILRTHHLTSSESNGVITVTAAK